MDGVHNVAAARAIGHDPVNWRARSQTRPPGEAAGYFIARRI